MLIHIIGRGCSEVEVEKICAQYPEIVPWLLARIDGVNQLREREGKSPTFEKYVCAARSVMAAVLIERGETSAAEAQVAALHNLCYCPRGVIEHLERKIHHLRSSIARALSNASLAEILSASRGKIA